MRVPLSWLQDFTPVNLPESEIAATFNSLGLVVEGIEHVGEGLDGVVVGHVLEVRRHPNADKVRLADIDLGTGESVQIACGGLNLAAGQLVPVATLGTTLPDGMTIERRKLRGEWSNGMICSEDELGLGERGSEPAIMVLPEGLAVGAPFAQEMGIIPDIVFDLEIETNRPDAMCIAGVARDLAGKLRLPFAIPEPVVEESATTKVFDIGSVVVEDTDLCPRFTLRTLTNVTVCESPELVKRRLTLAGMRPINNVVDASNYVMLELGAPSHPFDRQLVKNSQLRIRKTRPGETIETLDGSTRSLPPDAGVVCDGESNVIAVAGIMGGASSEIGENTKEVLLEVAIWEPYSINQASRRLALRTDASARFEKRTDREGVIRAQNRICQLIKQSSPGAEVAQGIIDENVLPAWPSDAEKIAVRTKRVNAILGTSLSNAEVSASIAPIGFVSEVTEGNDSENDGVCTVTIPSFRPDCEREIDVIEEIARMFGYENIERRVPTSPAAAQLSPYQQRRRQLRSFLIGRGFAETWTAALLGPADFERAGLVAKPISLTNPVVQEESLLRTSFLPGMLRAIAFNVARQNHELNLFEIGHVFNQPVAGAVLADESERLAVSIVSGTSDAQMASGLWRDLVATLAVKGVSLEPASQPGLHPTRTVEIKTPEGRSAGFVGEVDPAVLARAGIESRVGWIEVDVALLVDSIEAVPKMKGVSRFPSLEFDLAFVVPNGVSAASVEGTLKEVVGDMLEEVTLFDVFRGPQVGEDCRSLAYRLRVASLEKTLSDGEAGELRRKAVEAVEVRHRAPLRA